MKIVIIGGTGLIGSKLVGRLRGEGHDAVAAAPATGVNTVTGDGLAEVLEEAQVVVDVANSPSFDAVPAQEFFAAAGRNLLAAEAAAGVAHHVTLSVVGTERLLDSGYFRAKLLQEDLVRQSGRPYTILRSTQFFEFMNGIPASNAEGGIIRLSPALVQPVAADDVAAALAEIALEPPVNGTIELAGPDIFPLAGIVGRALAAASDERIVVPDPHARYFGVELGEHTLVPSSLPRIGPTTFAAWVAGR